MKKTLLSLAALALFAMPAHAASPPDPSTVTLEDEPAVVELFGGALQPTQAPAGPSSCLFMVIENVAACALHLSALDDGGCSLDVIDRLHRGGPQLLASDAFLERCTDLIEVKPPD